PPRRARRQRPRGLVPPAGPLHRQRRHDRPRRREAPGTSAGRPGRARGRLDGGRPALPAAGGLVSRPRLAVNYSPPLAQLVAAGEVAIDLYKVPDWDDLIAAARASGPCYVHFPVDLGATRLGVDLDRAR